MVVCVRLIIDEGRERKRDKRSVDRLLQSNLDLDGREGTAMLGTNKDGKQPTPLTPREVVKNPIPNPTYRGGGGN